MPRDKDASFTKLLEPRMAKLEHNFKLIRNLANRYNYTYTDEQIEDMFSKIEDMILVAKQTFKEAPTPKGRIYERKSVTEKTEKVEEQIRTLPENIHIPDEDAETAPVSEQEEQNDDTETKEEEEFEVPTFLLNKKKQPVAE